MSATMFQISGAADAGEISATLTLPDDSTCELVNGSPVELESSGEYGLVLTVPGFPEIHLTLQADTSAGVISTKDGLLPSACALTRQTNKEEQSGADSAQLWGLGCNFGYARELLLVAGADFLQKGIDFDLYAVQRRRDQITKEQYTLDPKADANTIVTQFSFATGKRQSFLLCGPVHWMVVDEQDYGVPPINEKSADGLSITDVYDWIVAAGEAQEGRVAEFCIFSRAGDKGPILVNSKPGSGGSSRDPEDHDPRCGDFDGNTFDVSKFGVGIADAGQCFIFGADNNVMRRACAGVVAEPEPEEVDRVFKIKQPDGSTVNMTWQQCKGVLGAALDANYSRFLAKATGVMVWSPAPGAVSKLDKSEKRRLMGVETTGEVSHGE
jgi:hypothetical protein